MGDMGEPKELCFATRASDLALAQTRWVAGRLREAGFSGRFRELHIRTEGDRIQDRSLEAIGGKGLFVTEVEQAVLDGRAHVAVHSMKDLPAKLADGLAIHCVPRREDPRDVVITNDTTVCDLGDFVAGARLGTGSKRRAVQIRQRRPDLVCVPIRGNVPTRLRKVNEMALDGVVLALAGLRRLGLERSNHWVGLPSIPAAGQGSLALESRLDDAEVTELLSRIQDMGARVESEAERAFVKRLGADCQAPVAGHARWHGESGRLRFSAMVADPHGERVLSASSESYVPETQWAVRVGESRTLGLEVAENLIARGAMDLIRSSAPVSTKWN